VVVAGVDGVSVRGVDAFLVVGFRVLWDDSRPIKTTSVTKNVLQLKTKTHNTKLI